MSLLALPTELRYEVYSYLISAELMYLAYYYYCYPIMWTSHTPPPSALQRTCRFIYNDTMVYFYSTATLTFETPQPYKYTSLYECTAYAMRAIRCARKAEITFNWYGGAQLTDPNSGSCIKYIEDLVGLLEEAEGLYKLTVSVCDCFNDDVGWHVREEELAPLRLLEGKVAFVLGEVAAIKKSYSENTQLRERLEKYMGELNEVER